MIYDDRRLEKVRRWYEDYRSEGSVRVNPDMLLSVCFLCSRDRATNKEKLHGTGFFVTLRDDPSPTIYLVTARHAVGDAEGAGDGCAYLRINFRKGGFDYYQVKKGAWWTVTDGEFDNDVAVTPLESPERWEIGTCTDEMFLTDADLARYYVGIGDPLMVLGLFTSAVGKKQNRPIARGGMISAMPDEPIQELREPEDEKDPLPYNVYLAELRSIGGLSGSPVFVHLGYDREADGTPNQKGSAMLLGLIRGHWQSPTHGSTAHVLADDFGQVQRGIAMVTPIADVVEVLKTAQATTYRLQKAREYAEKTGGRSVLDAILFS